jgi:hypothetical protein
VKWWVVSLSLLLERVSIAFIVIFITVCVITSVWATVSGFADFACIICPVGQKPRVSPISIDRLLAPRDLCPEFHGCACVWRGGRGCCCLTFWLGHTHLSHSLTTIILPPIGAARSCLDLLNCNIMHNALHHVRSKHVCRFASGVRLVRREKSYRVCEWGHWKLPV